MAATRYYVDIENLETFWSKAKEYIQTNFVVNGQNFGSDNTILLNGSNIEVGGEGDYKSSTLQAAIDDIDGRLDALGSKDTELSTLISNLRTDLTTETTNRTNADATHTNAISEIKDYTVNTKKISTNPVLTGDDINLGSELDATDYPATQSITDSIDKLREGISEINAYKVNDKLVSSSPTLTGNDIDLGTALHSDYPADQSITESINKLRQAITGATIGGGMQLIGPPMTTLPGTTDGYSDGNVIIVGTKEYLCYNGGWIELGDVDAVSQSVSEILASYVKSIKGEGNGVTVTPTESTNGDVTIVVDASNISNSVQEIKSSYVKDITTTDGTYVKLTPDSATTGEVNVVVDDAGIITALAGKSDTNHNHSGVYVPVGRTVNGKALSTDITLGAGDVGAVPTTRKVNGKALSADITLGAGDVGAAPASHSHTMSHISDYGTYVYDATVPRTKNTVLAAPNGSNGVASFRALVKADLPPHTHTKTQITDYTDTKNTAGSTNSTSKLYLIGATSQAANPRTYSNSSVYTSGGMVYATDFVTTSDRRLKKNIVEVDEEMMKKSLSLKTYEFDFTNTGEHSIGYIAQEVQEVLPSMVKENECSDGEKFLAVKYTNIHSLQIKALINKVNLLEEENNELKEKLERLEKLVEKFA